MPNENGYRQQYAALSKLERRPPTMPTPGQISQNAAVTGFNQNLGSGQGGASSSGTAAANEDSRTGYSEEEFRDRLKKVLVGQPRDLSRDLGLFMAESDQYPRFVWQRVLLSFKLWEAKAKRDEWVRGNGPSLEVKLSRILREYPDILQRELLRDGLEKDRPDAYGALHAAVLWDSTHPSGTELMNLLMEPGIDARAKIFEQLEPTLPDHVSDSFHLMRRAVLWRYMRSSDDKYTKVANFMRDIEKARKQHTGLQDLRSLIARTSYDDIDLKDVFPDVYNPDPWLVILAWASVSDTDYSFILKEFKKEHTDYLDRILADLKRHKNQSKFVDVLENSENYLKADIVSLLVTGTIPNGDEGEPSAPVERIEGNPDSNHVLHVMEKCFLGRFCERTPESSWTPLHFAAAHGNVKMVRALIESCDKCLKTLHDKERPENLQKIVDSLYDAKHMTPLHYAVLENKKDAVMILMDWGIFKPHVDNCDILMRSAFQIACCSPKRYDIAKHLYDRSVDMDKENCCSFTAMHWAIYSGSENIAKLLIDRGVALSKRGVAVVSIIREYAKKDVQQSLLNLPSIKSETNRLYKDRQVFVDASNAILVGAALIASVTFGGWLQPPWGNDPDSTAVHVFWAFSSLSFFFSIATMMSGASSVLPYSHSDGNMKYAVESLRKWLLLTTSLLILSVALVLGAFAAGGFSSLLASPQLRTNMIITTSIGSFVCGTIGFYFCKRLISLSRPLWLDKVILKFFNVNEMRREIQHLFQDVAAQLCRGIFKRASSPLVSDSGTVPHDLRIVLANLHKIAVSAPKPSGNTDDEARRESNLREQCRRKFHRKQGTQPSCCVRNCYVLLESTCSDDLSKLKGIEIESSMLQFQEMWNNLLNTSGNT